MNDAGQAPVKAPEAQALGIERNPFLCLAIVVMLGVVALLATAFIGLCAVYKVPVPESLVAIASGATGSLGGALAVSGQVRSITGAARKIIQ